MHWKRSIWWRVMLAVGWILLAAEPACAQVRTLRAVTSGGKRYHALKDVAGMYGLPLTNPGGKTLLIRGQYVSLQFTGDGRQAILNGSTVWLHAPVARIRGEWHVSDADAQFILDPLVRPSAYLAGRGTRTVVIDPGHGGKDPGAIGRTGIMEKDLALDIALRVRVHLAALGVRVVMTRDTDRYWTLEDRPFLAARGSGDAFVSIHLNASATRTVRGVETFVTAAENYPPTAESRLTGRYPAVPNNRFNHSNTVLGHQIQRALVGITRAEDRGLKRARFQVLKDSAMPSALVECGFLSNPQEEQKLATPSYRETVAQGIAQGIVNYLSMVNRAKVELGAPVLQLPTQVAARAPAAAPAPIPMASRAWGPPAVPAPAPAAPAPAVVPPVASAVAPVPVAPSVVAPPVEAVAEPEVEAPAEAEPVPAAVAAPVPAPAAPPRPPQAIAPPPSKLLNPRLVTSAAE